MHSGEDVDPARSPGLRSYSISAGTLMCLNLHRSSRVVLSQSHAVVLRQGSFSGRIINIAVVMRNKEARTPRFNST